jgi:ferredoxin-NADP reductase/MOSC domain-containing protein YiiM
VTVEGAIRVGRLLAVNVGVPREIEWEGTTIRTGIWKEPVTGARMVRRINIDGDDQADRGGHGGEHRAVFVYQIQSYRYWEQVLGRSDFSHGQFGENFTVEGLPDSEVCVGDRYRIGTALFEVTQPRVTCFRVGIRMNEPSMPSLLVAHHRPGFYLRVLEEGMVEAGDEIVRAETGPEQLTIAEIDGLLYLPNRSTRTLKRALRVPALSEGWKDSFRALLEQSERPAPPKLGWDGFRPLTVAAITQESPSIVSVRLAASNRDAALTRFLPGQYLTVRLRPGGPAAAAVIRSYSLSTGPDEPGYRISVKRELGGIGSAYIHDRVAVGDTLEVAAPRGTFILQRGRRAIVLVSAGVGATPVLAMLHALAAVRETRRVWWIHGARNAAEHAFKQEVDELLEQLPHAHRTVTYSQPKAGDRPDATGRISFETIVHAGIPDDAEYFLCGPAAFMHDLSASLTAHGVPPERINAEVFGPATAVTPGQTGQRPAPHVPAGPAGTGAPVTFARSNLTVAWDPAYLNLLELAEACDVPASYGCRHGVCHYCEVGLLTGRVSYGTEPLERPPPDRVLLCCAQPAEQITVEL